VTLEAARPLAKTGRLADSSLSASLAALVAFVPVVSLAGAQGGFFPSAWGWASLPLFLLAAVTLAVRERIRLSRGEQVFVGLLAAFTAWILLSAIWSVAPAESILETQRALVYLAGVLAALVVSRSRYMWEFLGGVLAAISAIAVFSLATRVLPDRVGAYDSSEIYRLAQPIGYWNALALYSGIGALLALCFAARGRSPITRGACAALLVVLLPTVYFAYGRAAWIALVFGLAAALVVDRRRLQLAAALLVVGPAPALGVLVASRQRGLTHSGASFGSAVQDGHRLALLLLALAALNAVVAVAFAFGERRVTPGPRARRIFVVSLALVLAAALMSVFGRYGGPVTLADKGYRAFKAPPSPAVVDLNRRLLSFSGNGRDELWRLAWDDAKEHRLLGAGSGTYERYFLAHQPAGVGRVRDAHGLYIETLAELGPFGVALLLAALLLPLARLAPARGHPLIPGAVGGYIAYLVHTGVDWDWELPAVTLAGLFCGAAILLAGRSTQPSFSLTPIVRWAAVALIVVVCAGAAVGLAGNTALSRSDSARRQQDWVEAAAKAHLARSWMPWSPAPWEALGRAQLGAARIRAARLSFRKAISFDRTDWELWYYLASASTGDARRSALRQAADLFPRAKFLRARVTRRQP
jgi:O-antigen ligase